MSSNCIMLPRDFWKKLRIYLWSSAILTFLWVLAPPCYHIGCLFVSAAPSWTILLIDRSEPRFKRHTGDKITRTLKNDGNFDGFCSFLAKSDSKLFRPDQENERRDI